MLRKVQKGEQNESTHAYFMCWNAHTVPKYRRTIRIALSEGNETKAGEIEWNVEKNKTKKSLLLFVVWLNISSRLFHSVPSSNAVRAISYSYINISHFLISFRFSTGLIRYWCTTACVNSSRRRAVPVVCVFALHGLCIKSVIGIIRN